MRRGKTIIPGIRQKSVILSTMTAQPLLVLPRHCMFAISPEVLRE